MRQIQPAVGQNFLAGMVGGVQAGQQMRQANDQNALRNLLAGADLNDPALAAQVAQYDPQMGMQMNQQNYQRERQERADARADQLFDMQVAEFAQNADDREKAEAAQMIEQGLIKGTQLFRAGDLQGLNMMLAEAGEQPISSLEEFPAIAAKYERVWETLQRTQPEVSKPLSAEGKLMADLQAGRITQEQFNAANQKSGMRVSSSPDGGFVFEQGVGVVGSGRPPTEGQLAGAGYLQRMTGSEQIIRGLEDSGLTAIPIAKSLVLDTKAEGYVLSPEEASLAQAQRDWVRAKLRKESGAVIADEEMASEIKTYFPLPGEGPEIVAQKRAARARAERQMQIGAGSAAPMAGELSDSATGSEVSENDGQISMTPEQKSVFDRYSR